MRFLLSALLLLCFSACSLAPNGSNEPTLLPPAENLQRPNIKGLWVATTDPTLDSSEGVEALFDKAQKAGITDIYVQVMWRYATNWHADGFYQAKAQGRDVYHEALNAGGIRGIRVHAWYTVMLAGNPDSPNPLWQQHGISAPNDLDKWVTRSFDGQWSDFLDPALPEVKDLAIKGAVTLAQRHPASVHLDFIRYPEDTTSGVEGSMWGYNPRALEIYATETGNTIPPETDSPEWADWKEGKVTEIVKGIKEAINPTPLSAAVVTWGAGPSSLDQWSSTSAMTDVMQNWVSWAENGYVNQLVVMNYFDEQTNSNYHNSWATFAGQVRSTYPNTQVVLGQGAYLNNPADTITQLERGLSYVDGWVLYANDTVDTKIFEALEQSDQ